MPNKWDDEDESSDDSSSATSSPPAGPTVVRRNKFDDEEEDNGDVLESWSDAEDSEVEREKAKVAAEKQAIADKEAAANKKSKAQRIAEKQAEKARQLAEQNSDESSDEDEAARRERLRRTEQDSDLKHAEDLFGNIGISNRKATTAANAVVIDSKDPNATLDLTTLPLFDPKTKLQFEKLRDTLIPVLTNNSKKAHYVLFLQEFTKQLAKDLPSEQIKKVASGLTALSNEKMKEEKLAEKGGKKSKAQKTKVGAVMNRNESSTKDVNAYDDFGDDDFM